jgi:hypothetical protein
VALAQRRVERGLDDAGVRERIARLGATEFHEVRAVLRQDRFLLPPGDVAAIYEEFAALYLELRYFAPDRLGACFPDLTNLAAVDGMLAADVDAGSLFNATRPEGVPDSLIASPPRDVGNENGEAPPITSEQAPACTDGLSPLADLAAAQGNLVRAAILRQRAGHAAPAQEAIAQLARRFADSLALPAGEFAEWRQALVALVEPAALGRWPIEARLLYDLQKVCVDRERAIYAVDLVEWIISWGRRPIKRLLPLQPPVLTVKHLHTALHRLSRVRISEPVRARLGVLMAEAVHRSERELRDRLRPIVLEALDRVALKPANYAERVSRDKLIEELLDRIVQRRFLTMSDLRDAIARNQLKLPDLAGLREFLLGDKLIRANRELADRVDGIYRRGEIYLRWLQRLSSAAFGTAVGRFLTLYFALPFGGAYLGLEAVHHIIELFRPPHHIRAV